MIVKQKWIWTVGLSMLGMAVVFAMVLRDPQLLGAALMEMGEEAESDGGIA